MSKLQVLESHFLEAVGPCRLEEGLLQFASLHAEGAPKRNENELLLPISDRGGSIRHSTFLERGTHIVHRMKGILLESASREIVLSHYFLASQVSLQSFRSIRGELTDFERKTNSRLQQTQNELSITKKELLNLDRISCQAQAERAQVRRNLHASLARFGHENSNLKNNGDECRKALEQTRSKLQSVITKAESSTIAMEERLRTSDTEKAKLGQDFQDCTQALRERQEELESSRHSSDEKIKQLQISLKESEERLSSGMRLYDSSVAELRQNLAVVSAEKEQAAKALSTCEQNLQLAQEDLESSTKHAHSAGAETQGKLLLLEQEMVKARAEIDCLRKKVDAAKTETSSTARKLKGCEAKLESTSKELRKAELALGNTKALSDVEPPLPRKSILPIPNCAKTEEKRKAASDKTMTRRRGSHATDSLSHEVVDIHPDNECGMKLQDEKDSPNAKKRLPNKSIQKANRSKRSRVKPPRTVAQQIAKFGEDLLPPLQKRRGSREASPGEEEIDDDWIVKDIL